MWGSSLQPQLMAQPVAVPVSMMSTARPFTAFALPGNGFHDVMQQWHLHAGLSSAPSVTRVIGYLLVFTTAGLQVPDIINVLRSRNCEGVSMLSVAIFLHSTSANVAYCINKNFPLSTWAESIPLMAQYITLMCLLLCYRGQQRKMQVFVLLYVLLMLALLLGAVPGYIVCGLKILTVPPKLVGKVSQLRATYKRGDSDQVSKSSVILLHLRSAGRLLTSLFDTRDTVLVVCYAHACLWNTLITCQLLYYGHKKRRRLRREAKRQAKERAAQQAAEAAASTSEASSSSNSSDSDGETGYERTRRRRRCCNSVSALQANAYFVSASASASATRGRVSQPS